MTNLPNPGNQPDRSSKFSASLQAFIAAWRVWVPLLVVLLGLFGVTLGITQDETGTTVTIHRGSNVKVDPPGPTPPITVDTGNTLQKDEQKEDASKSPNDPAIHEDMRDETPPGVSTRDVVAGRDKTEALAAEELVDPQPPAGAQAYSCPNALVRNRSAVNGPRVGTALHFTVSSPGSLDAIRGLFNTPSFGASSNYIIELNGRCRTLVPRAEKAWAQGAANSAYFSIEIVTNDLSRASWLASPIIRKGILAALVRDLNRSIGAPLKRVDPSGCTWTPGIVDHDALECGNTHWDVGKNFPWDVFIKQVKTGVCSQTCRFRREHKLVHARIRRRHCTSKPNPGPNCKKLTARNQLLHRVAKKRGIKL